MKHLVQIFSPLVHEDLDAQLRVIKSGWSGSLSRGLVSLVGVSCLCVPLKERVTTRGLPHQAQKQKGYIPLDVDLSDYFEVVLDKPHSLDYATCNPIKWLPEKFKTPAWTDKTGINWWVNCQLVEVWKEDVESFKRTQLLGCGCPPMYTFLDKGIPKVVLPEQLISANYKSYSNPTPGCSMSRTLQIFWDMLTLKEEDTVIVWPSLQGGEGDPLHLQMRIEQIVMRDMRVVLPRIPPNARFGEYTQESWTQCLKDMATQICKFMGTDASQLLKDENLASTVRQGRLLKKCLKGELSADELKKEDVEFKTALHVLLKALVYDLPAASHGDLGNVCKSAIASVEKLKKSLFDFDLMEVYNQLSEVTGKKLEIAYLPVDLRFDLPYFESWDHIKRYIDEQWKHVGNK